MHRVLSHGLWTEIRRQSRKGGPRRVAVAYVTKDLIGLERGDVLVTDASARSIRCGDTDASLLRRLHKRGVEVYSCEGLHAKAGVLGGTAFVGSANMSASSAGRLVEAGLVTDAPSVVAAVASFVEQIRDKSPRLTTSQLAALCSIEVVRRGRPPVAGKRRTSAAIRPLGHATWVVGVRELVKDPPPAELHMIDRVAEELGQDADDLEWLRWGTKGSFAKQCREGDLLIQLWRPSSGKGTPTVHRMVPVVRRQSTKHWTRFYLGSPVGSGADRLGWGRFKRLLKSTGYRREIRPGSVQLLDDETANAIARIWPKKDA